MYKDFQYCDRWYDSRNLSRDDFDKAINSLVEDKYGLNEEKKEVTEDKSIGTLIKENLIWIILATVVLLSLITLIILKIRKGRRQKR